MILFVPLTGSTCRFVFYAQEMKRMCDYGRQSKTLGSKIVKKLLHYVLSKCYTHEASTLEFLN